MHDHLPISAENGFYSCASGGLGHGLPAAVGVALARPGERVVALLGDGSSLYSIQGLWSAAQLGLPVCFLILNNRGYRALDEFGRLFGLDRLQGSAVSGIDFCALAASFGMAAMRIAAAAEIDDVLRRALDAPGPVLVEALIE
jgi:benzoylformate decarboxylase